MTHLTSATNVWSVTSPSPVAGTFLFADIAGYTALTEAHGDADAAELALAFCRELSDVARARGGEIVKTIGDAVMVRHADPSQAVELGVTAAHEVLLATARPPCVWECTTARRSAATAIGSAPP